jgi:hypothetical protein
MTVKQSVVTKVSIPLLLSFIRRSNSLWVALLSAHNLTNLLPPPAIQSLIDLSRGYSKVLLGYTFFSPPNPPLSTVTLLIPSTRCKMGSGV